MIPDQNPRTIERWVGAWKICKDVGHKGEILELAGIISKLHELASYLVIISDTIAIGEPVRILSPDEKDSLVDAIRSIGFTKNANPGLFSLT